MREFQYFSTTFRKGQGKPHMHVLLWGPGTSPPVTELKWPVWSKANLLTPGGGEESVWCRAPCKESRAPTTACYTPLGVSGKRF